MKVDYEGSFYIKVGRKCLKTDIDTTYIENLQKENAELKKALTITQERYFPLQDKFIKTREILEDILRLLAIYKISDADKKYLERAEQFLKGGK